MSTGPEIESGDSPEIIAQETELTEDRAELGKLRKSDLVDKVLSSQAEVKALSLAFTRLEQRLESLMLQPKSNAIDVNDSAKDIDQSAGDDDRSESEHSDSNADDTSLVEEDDPGSSKSKCEDRTERKKAKKKKKRTKAKKRQKVKIEFQKVKQGDADEVDKILYLANRASNLIERYDEEVLQCAFENALPADVLRRVNPTGVETLEGVLSKIFAEYNSRNLLDDSNRQLRDFQIDQGEKTSEQLWVLFVVFLISICAAHKAMKTLKK